MYTELSIKPPSHSTVLLWLKKLGIYHLNSMVQEKGDWVIIIDESIKFGSKKLLVIYGLKESAVPFDRALTFNDLTPLCIKAGESWNGDLISDELKKIKQKIGRVSYTIADGGRGIVRGLRLSGIKYVPDITHRVACFLKQSYKEDESFVAYTKKMAKMRCTLLLSKVSHILPPAQRINSRFMNLSIISDWGMKVLKLLDKQEDIFTEEKRHLSWVDEYRDLINELHALNTGLNEILELVKVRGLSNKTIKLGLETLSKLETRNNTRISQVVDQLTDYLKTTKRKFKNKAIIICSSDIIESAFGKFKNYLINNPMLGITDLSLAISAFTSDLDEKTITKAMQSSKVTDCESWKAENIKETNLFKRRKILKK
jgi:hypothetical protein